MKARPILFSAPMIKALLVGTKTQTRRSVKPQPPANKQRAAWFEPGVMGWAPPEIPSQHWHRVRCPYGKPGDLLWVRETLRIFDNRNRPASVEYSAYCGKAGFVEPIDKARAWGDAVLEKRMNRRARAEYQDGRRNSNIQQVSAIHMPRWASRLTLRITDVRVQRLQDISEADAQAEGCAVECMTPTGDDGGSAIWGPGGYKALWESINGAGSWDRNEWCWCISFDVIKANVDTVLP